MTKYWLLITNEENLETIKESNIYGFNDNSRKLYRKINCDDKVILYLIPKRIIGFYKVIDKDLKNKISFKGGIFSSQMKLQKIKILNEPLVLNKEIVNMISVFKDKTHWGVVLMGKSCIEILEEDYNVLFNYQIKNHNSEGTIK